MPGTPRGLNAPMAHFGKLLSALRKARGWSQTDLAGKARVSDFTISSGENAAACPWKPSTAMAVFTAIDTDVPVSQGDAATYFELTGMTDIARHVDQWLANERAKRVQLGDQVKARGVATTTSEDPDETTAHNWIQKLIDEQGTTKVLAWLEGIATAWEVDLQPRVRRDGMKNAGQWIYHSEAVDVGEGRTVQIYGEVIKVPQPTKPKAQPKKRNAS